MRLSPDENHSILGSQLGVNGEEVVESDLVLRVRMLLPNRRGNSIFGKAPFLPWQLRPRHALCGSLCFYILSTLPLCFVGLPCI